MPLPVKFEIEDGYDINEFKTGTGRASLYPFEAMSVGQSFFVPITAERPNPARSLQSTVSTINRKGDKKYSIRAVEGGARVWRTE
jgi:hypothetical protein